MHQEKDKLLFWVFSRFDWFSEEGAYLLPLNIKDGGEMMPGIAGGDPPQFCHKTQIPNNVSYSPAHLAW